MVLEALSREMTTALETEEAASQAQCWEIPL